MRAFRIGPAKPAPHIPGQGPINQAQGVAIMPISNHSLKHVFQSPADDGEGGGGGGGDDQAAAIKAAVDAAVAGLKAKNSELLGSLKERTDKLKEFDGIDPTAVRAILTKFASEEEAALLAKGEIDTVLTKRTERMQAEHAKVIKAEQEARTRAEGKASKLAARTLAGAVRDAAIKAGAYPEAMEDIVLRAGSLWRLNDDGEPVAMNGDEVILSKDGKTPLTTQEWAESLRETAPHLWPKAQGTNAPGSAHGGRGQQPPKGNLGGTKDERLAAIKAMNWADN